MREQNLAYKPRSSDAIHSSFSIAGIYFSPARPPGGSTRAVNCQLSNYLALLFIGF